MRIQIHPKVLMRIQILLILLRYLLHFYIMKTALFGYSLPWCNIMKKIKIYVKGHFFSLKRQAFGLYFEIAGSVSTFRSRTGSSGKIICGSETLFFSPLPLYSILIVVFFSDEQAMIKTWMTESFASFGKKTKTSGILKSFFTACYKRTIYSC